MAAMAWEPARVVWLGNLAPTLPKNSLLAQLPSLLGLLDDSVRHRGSQHSSAGFLLFASRERRDGAVTFLRALGWDARAHESGKPTPATVLPPAVATGRLVVRVKSSFRAVVISKSCHECKIVYLTRV